MVDNMIPLLHNRWALSDLTKLCVIICLIGQQLKYTLYYGEKYMKQFSKVLKVFLIKTVVLCNKKALSQTHSGILNNVLNTSGII